MQEDHDRSNARPSGDSASSESTGPSPGRPRPGRASGPEVDPVVEAYKRDIDRTLLRQNLQRSVTERVANLIALHRLAEEARRAGAALRNESATETSSPPSSEVCFKDEVSGLK